LTSLCLLLRLEGAAGRSWCRLRRRPALLRLWRSVVVVLLLLLLLLWQLLGRLQRIHPRFWCCFCCCCCGAAGTRHLARAQKSQALCLLLLLLLLPLVVLVLRPLLLQLQGGLQTSFLVILVAQGLHCNGDALTAGP
jgi:hypothetical protein